MLPETDTLTDPLLEVGPGKERSFRELLGFEKDIDAFGWLVCHEVALERNVHASELSQSS